MKRVELILVTIVATIASCSATFVALRFSNSDRRGNNIETRALTIIDSANQPVAILSSTDDTPQFTLLDRQHRKRASLFLETNGTSLEAWQASCNVSRNTFMSRTPRRGIILVFGGANHIESESAGSPRRIGPRALTDQDVNLSIHLACATAWRLPLFTATNRTS